MRSAKGPIVACLLAVLIQAAPGAADDLTDIEQEIRGFLRTTGSATTTLREVAYTQASLRRTEPRVSMVVHLDEDGEAARVSDTDDVEGWFETGTEVRIVGFSAYPGYVDFGVRRRHIAGMGMAEAIFEMGTIRVTSPRGGQASPAEFLAGLDVLLELGPSLERLKGLENDLEALTAQLARERSAQERRRLLQVGIHNRREYGTLVNASPARLAALEQSLRDDFERLASSAAEDATEVTETVAYAELISELSQRATPAPTSHSVEAERWAQSVLTAVEALAQHCRRQGVACEDTWTTLHRDLHNWEAAVAAARRQGCSEPPLTLKKLQQALAERALDALVSRRIRACGIDFAIDAQRAAQVRIGPETAAALRNADRRVSAADMSNLVAAAAANATSGAGRTMEEAGRGLQEALRAVLDPQPHTPQTVVADGLHWTESSLGEMSWLDAQERCRDLSLAARAWRLPTFEELAQLVKSGGLGELASVARTKIAGCCVWSNTADDRRALAMTVNDGKRDWLRRRLGLANTLCVSDAAAVGSDQVEPTRITEEVSVLVTVVFRVTPSDASVYVDGKFVGQAGDGLTIRVSPGRHRIELVRPGYRRWELERVLASPVTSIEVGLNRG